MRVARSRAVLATSPGGALAGGQRACLVVEGVVMRRGGREPADALVAGLGGDRRRWTPVVPFPAALRRSGDGRLVGVAGPDGGLHCGLCGGWVEGDVPAWLAGHPVSLGEGGRPW